MNLGGLWEWFTIEYLLFQAIRTIVLWLLLMAELNLQQKFGNGLVWFSFHFAVDDEEKIDRQPACNQTQRTQAAQCK